MWGHLVVGDGVPVCRGLGDLLRFLFGRLWLRHVCGGLLGLTLFLVVWLGLDQRRGFGDLLLFLVGWLRLDQRRGLGDLLLLLVGWLWLRHVCGGLLGLTLFLVVWLGLAVVGEHDLVLIAFVWWTCDEAYEIPLVPNFEQF